MTVIIGHGYVGMAIASALEGQNIPFRQRHHQDGVYPSDGLLINAAGYMGSPNIDACESHRRETIEGNILWPLSLKHHPALHISTGCLYQGDNGGKGWAETDTPNFEGSFYSLTKYLAEEALKEHLQDTGSYILRIRQPFGWKAHPRNLLTKLKSYRNLMDVENSMSCIDDVAGVVAWFVKNRPPAGIYNLTNPGSLSVRTIADMLGLEKEWFTPEEFATACPSPRSNCLLNVDKLTAIHPLRDVHEAMEQAIRDYAG